MFVCGGWGDSMISSWGERTNQLRVWGEILELIFSLTGLWHHSESNWDINEQAYCSFAHDARIVHTCIFEYCSST